MRKNEIYGDWRLGKERKSRVKPMYWVTYATFENNNGLSDEYILVKNKYGHYGFMNYNVCDQTLTKYARLKYKQAIKWVHIAAHKKNVVKIFLDSINTDRIEFDPKEIQMKDKLNLI